jgi:hypothetical protein
MTTKNPHPAPFSFIVLPIMKIRVDTLAKNTEIPSLFKAKGEGYGGGE